MNLAVRVARRSGVSFSPVCRTLAYPVLASLILLLASAGCKTAPSADAGVGGGTPLLSCTTPGNYNTNNSSGCGSWRWSIKTGTDPNVGKIDLSNVFITTIANLDGRTPPSNLYSSTPRQPPMETTAYELKDIHITHVRLESDSDYHMEINDGAGHDMVAEIPYPGCFASTAAFSCYISQARAALEKQVPNLGPADTSIAVNLTASIIGVGFFDFGHGAAGAAPNSAEIHPVLRVCFGNGCDLKNP